MASFEERLEILIKENGVTLEYLANKIDITKSTLSRYKNGKREPKMHIVEKLVDYFNVSIDYLMGNTNERSPADKIKTAISDDPELIEFFEELKKREDLQLMFKQTKDLPPETIKQVTEIIKTFEKEQDDKPTDKIDERG